MPQVVFPIPATDAVEFRPASLDQLLAKFASWHQWGWIYRGMAHSTHTPLSSLERLLAAYGIHQVNAKRMENRGLAFFRQRARLYLKDLPADEDLLGWLTLMQHYGAPTRLTDWTYSPFVALFFAYQGMPDTSDAPDMTIWMLNARLLREAFTGITPEGAVPDLAGIDPDSGFGPREVRISQPVLTGQLVEVENRLLRDVIRREVPWPVPLAIMRPDARMVAQQACFVCTGTLSIAADSALCRVFKRESLWEILGVVNPEFAIACSASDTVDTITPKYACQHPRMLAGKILLPSAWRKQVLSALARMNITADVLFPGLDGVGRATALHMVTGEPALPEYYMHGG